MSTSTHYSLLALSPSAAPEEIRRAFRKEVARYHPDKVQHLGPEFQQMAATRTAALTEAYRVLMDGELRRAYDEELALGVGRATPPRPSDDLREARPDAPATTRHDSDHSARQARASSLVKRAVLGRLDAALSSVGTAVAAGSFDAIYQIAGRKALFRTSQPSVQLAVKVVEQVDAASVQDVWPAAVRLPVRTGTTCLLMFGSGVAPAGELAGSVSTLRRKTRPPSPLVIPIDIRDWAALVPPETPPSVRSLLDRLRQGN